MAFPKKNEEPNEDKEPPKNDYTGDDEDRKPIYQTMETADGRKKTVRITWMTWKNSHGEGKTVNLAEVYQNKEGQYRTTLCQRAGEQKKYLGLDATIPFSSILEMAWNIGDKMGYTEEEMKSQIEDLFGEH